MVDVATFHLLELLGLILGGSIALLRFWPQLRNVAIFFQIALILTQMFGFYMKRNPEQQEKLKVFISQVFNHYLQTHPEGQTIAKQTDIDEKVASMVKEQKSNTEQEVGLLFGLTVDKQ